MATREELFCQTCHTIKPHVITDGDHVCLGCGWVNERHIVTSESSEPMPETQRFMQEFIRSYYQGVYFHEDTRIGAVKFLELLEKTGFAQPYPRAHSAMGACIFLAAVCNNRPFVYSELVRGEMSINDLRTTIQLVAYHLKEKKLVSRLPNGLKDNTDNPLRVVEPSKLVLRYCCQLGVDRSYHRSILEATQHADHLDFGFGTEPDQVALSVIFVKCIELGWRCKPIEAVAALTGQTSASLLSVIPFLVPHSELLFPLLPRKILEEPPLLVELARPFPFSEF